MSHIIIMIIVGVLCTSATNINLSSTTFFVTNSQYHSISPNQLM